MGSQEDLRRRHERLLEAARRIDRAAADEGLSTGDVMSLAEALGEYWERSEEHGERDYRALAGGDEMRTLDDERVMAGLEAAVRGAVLDLERDAIWRAVDEFILASESVRAQYAALGEAVADQRALQ